MEGTFRSVVRMFLLLGGILGLRAGSPPEIFVPLGHTDAVMNMAFSPDGTFLASGGIDGNVILWDLRRGKELKAFLGHTNYITALAFAPDGRRLVSGGGDGTIRMWDVDTGLEQRRFTEIFSRCLAFDRAGDLLAGDSSGAVRRLEAGAGTTPLIKADWKECPEQVVLPPGSGLVLAGGRSGFRVADASTGQVLRLVGEFADYPTSTDPVAISPDGKLALRGVKDGLFAWDMETGSKVPSFEADLDKVQAVVFTPDGRHVVAGGSNGLLVVWETATRKVVNSIYWYSENRSLAKSGVGSLALTRDGLRVAASYPGCVIQVWDLFRAEVIIETPAKDTPAWKAGLTGGDQLLALDGRPLTLWEDWRARVAASPGRPLKVTYRRGGLEGSAELTPEPTKVKDDKGAEHMVGRAGTTRGAAPLQTLATAKDSIASAALSPDGRIVAVGHASGRQSLWDLQLGTLLRCLDVSRNLSTVAFTPRGTQFLAITDGRLSLWNLVRPEPQASFEHGNLDMFNRALAITPDGRFAVSGGKNILTILDLSSLKETRTLLLPPDYVDTVNCLAASPDSRRLASGDGRMKIRLWDLDSGANTLTVDAGSWVHALAFSPDGRRLISGALARSTGDPGRTLLVWDLSGGRILGDFGGYSRSVRAVRFSPDGRRILTGGDELILWDAASGARIRSFTGHRDLIYFAAFLGDGRHALSGSGDGTLRVWDLEAGRETAQFIAFRDGEWVAVTPEGFFNASAGGARHLSVRAGNTVFGIDQFYPKFFRPELVRLALAGRELPRGESLLELLARKPAPAVRILSPASGAVDQPAVSIAVQVTDQGGGIGQVNLYLNGAQVSNDARGVAVKGPGDGPGRTLTFQVPLLPGANELRVVAFNQENSMESVPATVALTSRAVLARPVLHALVVGIDTYRNQSIALKYAVSDARAFAQALRRCAGPLFDRVEIRELTTPEATTQEAVVGALEALRGEVGPNDLFVFYDASHGVVDTVDGEEQYFLLTSNVLLLSSRRLGADALGQKDLARLLGNIPAQKKVVFLDTCNAGKGGKEIQIALLQQTRGLTEVTAIKLLQRAVGSAVFSASSDAQAALEGYHGHGLFTHVLLEGLQGKADLKKDGFITVLGLADYLEEQVTRLSEEVFKRQQTPVIQTGANFPIGRVAP